jgi:glycosyltransferase involved in cell wall biosynthesis
MTKRIYIEGLGLVEGFFTGIGQYIAGILHGLDQIIDDAKYAGEEVPEIVVIIPRGTVAKFLSFNFKHIRYKTFPLSFRMMSALWHRGKMPPLDLWYGKGAYIFPRFVDMPLLFSKSALVIYDLSYELHRQYADEGNAVFLSKHVKRSLKNTSKVIAISQHAKKELVAFYGLKPESVAVATPAADPAILYRRSPAEIERVKRGYGIDGDYILALSSFEPRKNLDGLVDAYCELPEKYRKNVQLLLVGVNGWKIDKLFDKIIGKVQQGNKITRPSHYVSDNDKAAILSGAKVLVFPSHYEGFGMPPLEALACGTPVICADNSSLPEAVGNMARMVKSTDTNALRDAIAYCLENNEALAKQSVTGGPLQAEKFSWKQSAQVFLDAAKEISK